MGMDLILLLNSIGTNVPLLWKESRKKGLLGFPEVVICLRILDPLGLIPLMEDQG